MSTIEVNHEDLNSLIYGVCHFPEGTPNRWELVCEFVRSSRTSESCDGSVSTPVVRIGKNAESAKKAKVLPLNDRSNCKILHTLLSKSYPSLLRRDDVKILFKDSGKTSFKPIILLPTQTKCCGKNIKMDNRPSFPIVYSMSGTYVGALFHGECRDCKTKYFPNYKITNEGQRIYYDPMDEVNVYFQVTSKTVFEKELLRDMSNNIWVTGATFQSRAKVYNLNFSDKDRHRLKDLEEFARTCDGEWRLNEQRVKDAWFVWVVVNYYNSVGKLASTDINHEYCKKSNRLNTEKMCKHMWEDICASPNRWAEHCCETPGCAEGYITVDGNEYLKRSKCALPMTKVKIRKDLPVIFKCCPNSPQTGGKHQTPSKFCSLHENHENEADLMQELTLPPEFQSSNSESAMVEDNNEEGCKKAKNISLFFETTAGVLALIRPCGIVVNMTEMFTSESYTQVFLFLLRTFCHNVSSLRRLRYLGYDRACGLVPFLKNQAKNGSAGAKVLLENVKFLVDIFHVSKHTEDVCMPPDNPNCVYHPSLPQFDEIKGANTESCEQGFKRLNQYLELTRKMTQYKRNVLFWFVNEKFNLDLEKELKRKNLM